MKVLLSAYACAPGWGSEPGIGWGVAAGLAERHDVWVLTGEHSRGPIEASAGSRPARLHVDYVDVPDAVGSAGTYVSYLAWQAAAYHRARGLHREVGFDLAQHVTYANSAMPSWLGRLGIPFVWYAGSFVTTPLPFLAGLGPRSSAHEAARNTAVKIAGRAARRLTLTANAMTIAVDAPPAGGGEWRKLLLGGLQPWELAVLHAIPARRDGGAFRVLSAGRMLGWKGFHLGLRAFARLAEHVPEAEYWLIGDGEQRPRLERLAAELGLSQGPGRAAGGGRGAAGGGRGGKVRFLGACTRDETFAAMAGCDVMVHPSWHEQVGFVVLEAMAAGRPVVCLDVAGPPELVGDAGVVVARSTPDHVVGDLAEALISLHGDPAERHRLGAAARRRSAEHWNWERVTRHLEGVYGELLGGIGTHVRPAEPG